MKTEIKELSIPHGFACNSPGCPCGAEYGIFHPEQRIPGYSDVMCEEHAIENKWIKPQD